MDLIYTDNDLNEIGVLHDYDLDFDTTSSKDFQIDVGVNNNVINEGFWYINGTEYGGRIDRIKIDNGIVSYTGRNCRGLLDSYIVQPLPSADYAVFSGTIVDITNRLLRNCGIDNIFYAEESEQEFEYVQYRFNRYITLYQALLSLAVDRDLTLKLTVNDGKVKVSYTDITDYTDEQEYNNDNIGFVVEKNVCSVNHLICLGQGDLAERQVVHLYADNEGNISQTQYYYGVDEITATYENTQSEDIADLKENGISHFKEIMGYDTFDVKTTKYEYNIGDIIGGYEDITKTYVAREIENIILNATEEYYSLEYKVGKDDTATAKANKRQGQETNANFGLYVDTEGYEIVISKEGASVPTFAVEDGYLSVTGATETYSIENGFLVREI